MNNKMILLNPGPVNVTDRVRKALLRNDICHREEDFTDLLERIRTKLLRVLGIEKDYTVVVFTGSGTAAQEAAIISTVSDNKSMLVVSNGVYGERIVDTANIYKIKTIEDRYEWGQVPDVNRIRKLLEEEPDIEVVAAVHHETTTGVLNPIDRIGKLCKEYNKIFFADTVSSLGGEYIDFYDGLDICIGSPNKCLHGFPGVSFVIFKKELLEHMKKVTPRSNFLNLPLYLDDDYNENVPFTPSVQIMFAFDEALDELMEEGYQNRIKIYKERACFIRKGLKDLGLQLFLPENISSNSLTSVCLPEGFTYEYIHDELRKKGYIIYAGQGGLKCKMFRISNMGEHSYEDYNGLFAALKDILKKKDS
ncbi:MAG: pyridoxal-phosphate-dependent aminotransferase family protein [Candidatus Anammoxibacter sp.]